MGIKMEYEKKIFPEDKPFASVSVVIPCFKSKDTILRAVESVFQQTQMPVEVILVDDCSPDDTLQTLQNIQEFYPKEWIKIVSLSENVGAGSARNRGWDCATQDYIAFLDSDDSWHPQKIEIQYGWMLQHPNAVLTGHRCTQISDRHIANSVVDQNSIFFEQVSRRQLLISNRFPTRSVMLRRDIPFRFLEGKRYSEDYLLWLDILLSGAECYTSAVSLAFLYKDEYGAGGLSSALWKMEKGELGNYFLLWKSNRINFFLFCMLFSWSFIKFLKRLIL